MEYVIKTKSIGGMTEDQFYHFCQENESLRFERNPLGDIILMEPTGSEMDAFNLEIVTDLVVWNRQAGLGYVFGSNAGFTLPNKAVRSPDGAFILKSRYEALPPQDRKKFAHICPDFVIEILSETDRERSLRDKMIEWIENGCGLAWMINPRDRNTVVFSAAETSTAKGFDEVLTGGAVLPGFRSGYQSIRTSSLSPCRHTIDRPLP